MSKHSLPKRIAIDTLGVLLLISALLLGWLPGPGGVPLLIAGLSLLSINHEWARKLLLTVKNQGLSLSEKLFAGHPYVRMAVDAASLLLITLAFYLYYVATRNFIQALSITLGIMGLALFMGNRRRLQSLIRYAGRWSKK